jgi:ATP-dependent Clp protease adaptor protein ClpS
MPDLPLDIAVTAPQIAGTTCARRRKNDAGRDRKAICCMDDLDLKTKTKVIPKTEKPKLYKVLLLNDDFTPRDFVVLILKSEFRMTVEQAYRVMITAHRRGLCVVAVFTKDIAETKATRATDMAQSKGFPLQFTTEPEE